MKEVKNNEQSANTHIKKLVVLSMLVAVGVVISPILRVEGMCPMAHLINIVCAVFLVRGMLCCVHFDGYHKNDAHGYYPLALTGAVFVHFFQACYIECQKEAYFAVIGEVIGTGIIGAVVSYPVMTFIWGREGLSWLFYVPPYIGNTHWRQHCICFSQTVKQDKNVVKMQKALGSADHETNDSVFADSLGIAALGVVGYLAILIIVKLILDISSGWALYLPYIPLAGLMIIAVVYFFVKQNKISKD